MARNIIIIVAFLASAMGDAVGSSDNATCAEAACEEEQNVRSTVLLQSRQLLKGSQSMTLEETQPEVDNQEGTLKTEYDDHLCLDHDFGSQNVYMHPCHDGNNQKWYINDNKQLKNEHAPSKCLDYDFGNTNVYMHPCHAGKNQQWYFDGKALKTNYDDTCLDYNYGNKNVYMHGCHEGSNQKWVLGTTTTTTTKCVDTDNGATNGRQQSCSELKYPEWFTCYDDYYYGDYFDDSDFTARDMCCACKGPGGMVRKMGKWVVGN